MGKKWTKEDFDFLRANYGVLSHTEIAKILNRTYQSIQTKICLMGLREPGVNVSSRQVRFKDPQGTKTCIGCHVRKNLHEFYKGSKSNRDGKSPQCITCVKERKRSDRLRVLQHYSSGDIRCACCPEDTYEFLSIAHVNNDGNAHRRDDPSAYNLVGWLIRNGFPEGFQVLCHNCNMAKSLYGECPHQRDARVSSS